MLLRIQQQRQYISPKRGYMCSSLKLVVSDLRARLGASKVENFFRLDKSSTKFLGEGRLSESWKPWRRRKMQVLRQHFPWRPQLTMYRRYTRQTHSMVSPCFSFGASLDSSEVGVQILWKGETRGGYFQFSVSSWYETMKRRHNSVTKPADYRTSTTYNIFPEWDKGYCNCCCTQMYLYWVVHDSLTFPSFPAAVSIPSSPSCSQPFRTAFPDRILDRLHDYIPDTFPDPVPSRPTKKLCSPVPSRQPSGFPHIPVSFPSLRTQKKAYSHTIPREDDFFSRLRRGKRSPPVPSAPRVPPSCTAVYYVQ